MNNVDMGTVISNTLFSFSFTGILTLLVLVAICALWCTVPFAVFGVKKRLDGIEVSQRSQTEMLIGELKRINDNLRQRVSSGSAVQAVPQAHYEEPAAPQPAPPPQPARAQTVRQRAMPAQTAWPGGRGAGVDDAEIQAALDEAEREMNNRRPAASPPRPQTMLRPPPPAAPVSAAATMFGPRPRR